MPGNGGMGSGAGRSRCSASCVCMGPLRVGGRACLIHPGFPSRHRPHVWDLIRSHAARFLYRFPSAIPFASFLACPNAAPQVPFVLLFRPVFLLFLTHRFRHASLGPERPCNPAGSPSGPHFIRIRGCCPGSIASSSSLMSLTIRLSSRSTLYCSTSCGVSSRPWRPPVHQDQAGPPAFPAHLGAVRLRLPTLHRRAAEPAPA